jgi:hypothetical protein
MHTHMHMHIHAHMYMHMHICMEFDTKVGVELAMFVQICL